MAANIVAVVGGIAVLGAGIALLVTGRDTATGAALAVAGAAELGVKVALK